jgi:hypothetical protein
LATIADSRRLDAPSEPSVLGWLRRGDFDCARRGALGFSQFGGYRDFIAERDALLLGYASAGVTAYFQRVPIAAFESWVRLTGAPFDIDGLDEFAAHWRWRAQHPGAAVMGRFGVPGHPERNPIDAAGVQCLRIRPEIFVRWRDDYSRTQLLAAPSLDVYAAHVVEFCLSSQRRARGPEVSSA